MADPFVGEIRMFGGNFAPVGWAFCDGSLLSIADYDVLFQLIGTTYGGDGQTTYAVPDLRGRIPLHIGTSAGSTYFIGQSDGTETATLTQNQLPIHSHALVAAAGATRETSPVNNWFASGGPELYASHRAPASGAPQSLLGPAGGNLSHSNLMPSQCITFIISLFGIFPSQ